MKCDCEKPMRVVRISRRHFYFGCTNPECELGEKRVRKFLVERTKMVCRATECKSKVQTYHPTRTRCECGAYLYPLGL
jgi:hypothetical protein